MILKRNPGSNSGGGSASQQGLSPTGQGSPTPPFGRESSPFGDNTYSNSGRRSGAGYREEDPDLVGGDMLRRQMDGMSLRDRNRALWDQAYVSLFILLPLWLLGEMNSAEEEECRGSGMTKN